MTKGQLIIEIHKLRRPGDPLIPCGTKEALILKLTELQQRKAQLLGITDAPNDEARHA